MAAAAALRRKIESLDAESEQLDAAIAALSSELASLATDAEHAPYAYVTRSDLRELALAEDSMLLAVRCPEGTQLRIAGA